MNNKHPGKPEISMSEVNKHTYVGTVSVFIHVYFL